jgi:hypothetical protein
MGIDNRASDLPLPILGAQNNESITSLTAQALRDEHRLPSESYDWIVQQGTDSAFFSYDQDSGYNAAVPEQSNGYSDAWSGDYLAGLKPDLSPTETGMSDITLDLDIEIEEDGNGDERKSE